MADVIHVRGEGGAVYAMALPLAEGIADRLAKGYLTRVAPDGSPWVEAPDGATPVLPSERPLMSANKATWVGWAVRCGMDPDTAEALTKGDLIDQFGTAPAVAG